MASTEKQESPLQKLFSTFASTGLVTLLITALLFTFGVAFSESFYRNLGLPSTRVLDFTTQDYVVRSYSPIQDIYLSSNLFILTALAVAVFFVRRSLTWSSFVLIPVSIVVILYQSQTVEYISIRFMAVAVLGIAIWDMKYSTHKQAFAIVGLLAVSWGVGLHSAAVVGYTKVCDIVEDPPLAKLVVVTTDEPPFETNNSDIEIVKAGDRWRISGLRAISSTPAGLVVYPKNSSPRSSVMILPTKTNDVLQFVNEPDVIDGESCE